MVTDVQDEGPPEENRMLVASWPNPCNPGTTVSYHVPRRGWVSVQVYDPRGGLVRALVSGEHESGSYRVPWDGRADTGRQVASGVYLIRFVGPGDAVSAKIIVLR